MGRPTAIVSLDEPDTSPPWIKLGVYGWPGIGKTPLVGTAPKCLILNADGSSAIESARATGSTADVWAINDYTDLDEAFMYLAEEDHPYRWAWLDSATLLQDRALLDEITAEAHAANPRQDPDVPSMKEYMKSQSRMARYIRQFVDLPIHFGVSFHVMSHETPDGEVVWCPLLQGGKNAEFSTKIQGYLNVIGYLHKREKEVDGKKRSVPYMRFESRGEYIARDRFLALPSLMAMPTVPKIEDAIREKVGALGGDDVAKPAAKRSAKKAPVKKAAAKKAAARKSKPTKKAAAKKRAAKR